MEPYDTPRSDDTPTRKRQATSEINRPAVAGFQEEISQNIAKRVKIAPLPVNESIHEIPIKSKSTSILKQAPRSSSSQQSSDRHSVAVQEPEPNKFKQPGSKTNRAPAPPPFEPANESLIDSKVSLEFIENVFKNIDDKVTKDEYLSFAKLAFDKWVNKGIEITNKQHELVKRIVVVRSKANLKFNFIFKLINNYGQGLETTDGELHAKMTKLQKLGEEIQTFIA